MNTKQHIMTTILFLFVLLLGGCRLQIAPVEAATCKMSFEATVYHGPSAGSSWKGQLEFSLDSVGRLSGKFLTDAGSEVAVSGQVNGQAISLVFTLEEGKYLFGTGVGTHPISSCSGVMGGSFTGPQPGDSGDWLSRSQSD